MNIQIQPARAAGTIQAPPSKSMAHRLLIAAALCDGVSTVRGISDCDDVAATLACLKSLGVTAERNGDDITVHGKSPAAFTPESPLDCHESGSTLRFLIPLGWLSGQPTLFRGAESLMQRPLSVYESLARDRHMTFDRDGTTLTVQGPLKAGDFSVVGNISSQFISGLLFALPHLDEDSTIRITTPVESRSYIQMTIAALAKFGVTVTWADERTLRIPGHQTFVPADLTVEGDYSGASFPDALNLFGGHVTIEGLDETSIQGDRIYRKYFDLLRKGTPTIHIGDCPDLGPILFAVAAARNGGIFSGTRRLKIKESDRASAMAEELRKFGTSVSVYEDRVVVYPLRFHAPDAPLCGHNDHRIVMALSILLSLTGGTLLGAEAVRKSYPLFFRDLQSLGIPAAEISAETPTV